LIEEIFNPIRTDQLKRDPTFFFDISEWNKRQKNGFFPYLSEKIKKYPTSSLKKREKHIHPLLNYIQINTRSTLKK